MAFRTHANQQQIASLDNAGEVGNGDLMPALGAPDVGKQQLLCVSGNGGP